MTEYKTLEDVLRNGRGSISPADYDEYLAFQETVPESLRGVIRHGSTVITKYVVAKVTGRLVGEGIEHPHRITPAQLALVKNAIEHPIAIIKKDDAVLVITDVSDYKKDPIVAIFKHDEKLDKTYVASIYGIKGFVRTIGRALDTDDLTYLDTARLLNKAMDFYKQKPVYNTAIQAEYITQLEMLIGIVSKYRDVEYAKAKERYCDLGNRLDQVRKDFAELVKHDEFAQEKCAVNNGLDVLQGKIAEMDRKRRHHR